ncbi:hypothetical protein C0431_00815 [bacterium]|nr:hypothetical protein [bacterium]
MIAAANDFCPECGYTIGKGEGSDTEVYQDLAQANLSRMRGDKQAAIDQCLKILRAFPNNVTAHSLLGEIYLEHGELTQAKEWFEMALDLDPKAVREKQMLDRVTQDLALKDHQASVETLEVKPKSGLTLLWATMVVLILLVGIASFFVGQNAGKKSEKVAVQAPAEPIRIPASEQATATPTTEPAQNPPDPVPSVVNAADDAEAVQSIFAKAQKGAIIQTILVNPAQEEVVLTAVAEADVPFETTALMLAGDVFVGRPATKTATVRIIGSAGRVAFVGSVERSAYDEVQGLSGGNTPVDELGVKAFPNAWHLDASTRPGSAVEPPDTGE